MDILKKVKEDLVGVLITLGENSLSNELKIKEADKIILETIKYIDPIIDYERKKEISLAVAKDILSNRHYNIQVITEEYTDNGDVDYEFYVAQHDYSAGRDTDTISKEEIEKHLLLQGGRAS